MAPGSLSCAGDKSEGEHNRDPARPAGRTDPDTARGERGAALGSGGRRLMPRQRRLERDGRSEQQFSGDESRNRVQHASTSREPADHVGVIELATAWPRPDGSENRGSDSAVGCSRRGRLRHAGQGRAVSLLTPHTEYVVPAANLSVGMPPSVGLST